MTTQQHSDAAYDFYNDRRNTKAQFIEFCAARGVNLYADETQTTLREDWADLVMATFDSDEANASRARA